MKTSNKFAIAAMSFLTVLTLTGCGNNDAKQSEKNHDQIEQIEEEANDGNSYRKEATYKNKTSTKPATSDNDNNKSSVTNNNQVTNQTTTGQQSNTTPAQQPQPGTSTNNNKTPQATQNGKTQGGSSLDVISTTEEALSLFEFDYFLYGGHVASVVPGGFYIKPKEPAFGHVSYIIKPNGDLYDTDGTILLKKFGDMAKAKDPQRPEYGWHGY